MVDRNIMINNKELEIKDKERLLELFNSILNLFDTNHNLSNNFLTGTCMTGMII